MQKLVEMSRKNYYTTGNLLDYLYRENYYKLIGIDLQRLINTIFPQLINFCRIIRKRWWCENFFFFSETQQKPIPKFSLDSLIATE